MADGLDGVSVKMIQMLREMKEEQDNGVVSAKPKYYAKQIVWRNLLRRGLIVDDKANIPCGTRDAFRQTYGTLTADGLRVLSLVVATLTHEAREAAKAVLDAAKTKTKADKPKEKNVDI